MTYRFNEELDTSIDFAEKYLADPIVDLLKELKERREGTFKTVHALDSYQEKIKVGIISVTCVCGETTNYKVPLKMISEFECPKRNV